MIEDQRKREIQEEEELIKRAMEMSILDEKSRLEKLEKASQEREREESQLLERIREVSH